MPTPRAVHSRGQNRRCAGADVAKRNEHKESPLDRLVAEHNGSLWRVCAEKSGGQVEADGRARPMLSRGRMGWPRNELVVVAAQVAGGGSRARMWESFAHEASWAQWTASSRHCRNSS